MLYLDAHYEKVRVNSIWCGTWRSLKAIGVNGWGKREVLGVSVELSEAEVHWREFLQALQRRGLKGVEVVASDDHVGLRSACMPSFTLFRTQKKSPFTTILTTE